MPTLSTQRFQSLGNFGVCAMDKYLAEKDIVLNAPMKVQSIEAVKRCVMNNLGIAVVPTYSIGEELKNGSLAEGFEPSVRCRTPP